MPWLQASPGEEARGGQKAVSGRAGILGRWRHQAAEGEASQGRQQVVVIHYVFELDFSF